MYPWPLQVIGTTVTFNGLATFIHNNAETVNGGAISLASFSQIFLNHGADINFVGNNGRYVLLVFFGILEHTCKEVWSNYMFQNI